MTRLTCLRGYPGSGKSTIARTLKGVVVCRDDLRMQLYGRYSVGPKGEEVVTVAERAMVTRLLHHGESVIVDAMHVNPSYLRSWARVASRHGAEFRVHDVPTPVEDCIKRDRYRLIGDQSDKVVGEGVIRQIAKRFPMEKWPTVTADEPFVIEPVEYIPDLADAIIVDVDGTLAHSTGRSPYDYSRVTEDAVDPIIRAILRFVDDRQDHEILIVSGRDDTCYAETERWLQDHQIPHDALIMRPTEAKDSRGNKLPDYIVKYNLFNEHIRGKYNVRFVLDDRQQVVDMWRSLGLKCLQVQPGDF